MTLKEFQCWLEGYSEGFIAGYPDQQQWAKIKSKLADISTGPTYNPDYNEIRPFSDLINPTPQWPYIKDPYTLR